MVGKTAGRGWGHASIELNTVYLAPILWQIVNAMSTLFCDFSVFQIPKSDFRSIFRRGYPVHSAFPGSNPAPSLWGVVFPLPRWCFRFALLSLLLSPCFPLCCFSFLFCFPSIFYPHPTVTTVYHKRQIWPRAQENPMIDIAVPRLLTTCE